MNCVIRLKRNNYELIAGLWPKKNWRSLCLWTANSLDDSVTLVIDFFVCEYCIFSSSSSWVIASVVLFYFPFFNGHLIYVNHLIGLWWYHCFHREADMTKERIEKLLKAGANVILTTKGIDDMALKASRLYFSPFVWCLLSHVTILCYILCIYKYHASSFMVFCPKIFPNELFLCKINNILGNVITM